MEKLIEKLKNLLERQIDNLETHPIKTTLKIAFIVWVLVVIVRKVFKEGE